jgi:hypothetical protein
MQKGPPLLFDGSEMLFLDAVKIQHVQEIYDEDRSDDLTHYSCGPQIFVLNDLGDGFADNDDAFAEDDECEQ